MACVCKWRPAAALSVTAWRAHRWGDLGRGVHRAQSTTNQALPPLASGVIDQATQRKPDRGLSTMMMKSGVVDEPRIALLAEIRNEPGALANLLRPFHDFNINLNRIESRPSKKGGEHNAE